MTRLSKGIALSVVLAAACSSDDPGPLGDVNEIVFVQRARSGGMGDVLQYTQYTPGARLVKLSPPTADGELTVLCCDDQGSEFADIDIMAYDISFDAREIVFSGKLSGDQKYGLFLLALESGEVNQIPTNPNYDAVYPVFAPGDKVVFMTNEPVDPLNPQFRDEYERGIVSQMATIRKDGGDKQIHAPNLSHRVHPSVMLDGRVMVAQWDHLGEMNAAHLVSMAPDGTVVREVFGKEGTGVTNSVYKAVEYLPGRVIAIGSSRDMTVQAGAILDIRLGETQTVDGEMWANVNMSEANSSVNILTPNVPRGEDPSFQGIGRYYSAYPLNGKELPDLLVSWADGPVQSEVLGAAELTANFGIYLYDSKKRSRKPILDSEEYWEVYPRPLAPRATPLEIAPSGKHEYGNSVLMGALNVYDSSVFELEANSVYGVRIIEGFSVEEGIPSRDFGLTEHEGAARLGVAPVHADGSWAALVPANTPVHQQLIDRFGVSLANEPVWVSGNPGESMVCGGCHESRSDTTVIDPGLTDAIAAGPVDLMSTVPRVDRKTAVVSPSSNSQIVGVSWPQTLQTILDAKCVSCHDGSERSDGANPEVVIVDSETGASQTFRFNLTGEFIEYGSGDDIMSGYAASHFTLVGPDMMELQEAGLEIQGELVRYMVALQARNSILCRDIVNPRQKYPVETEERRNPGVMPHLESMGLEGLTHAQEMILCLASDLGNQFFSRLDTDGVGPY